MLTQFMWALNVHWLLSLSHDMKALFVNIVKCKQMRTLMSVCTVTYMGTESQECCAIHEQGWGRELGLIHDAHSFPFPSPEWPCSLYNCYKLAVGSSLTLSRPGMKVNFSGAFQFPSETRYYISGNFFFGKIFSINLGSKLIWHWVEMLENSWKRGGSNRTIQRWEVLPTKAYLVRV